MTSSSSLDSLPGDWTDIDFDLRIADEDRYIDAAVLMTQVNAQPYSRAEWHFRIDVAHSFGHAPPRRPCGDAGVLDEQGIAGELHRARRPRGPGRGRPDVGPAGERAARVPPARIALDPQ